MLIQDKQIIDIKENQVNETLTGFTTEKNISLNVSDFYSTNVTSN